MRLRLGIPTLAIVLLSACGSSSVNGVPANVRCDPPALRFDATFAEGVRDSFRGPVTVSDQILAHPALRGMMKHQGATNDSAFAYYERARSLAQRHVPTWRALDMWHEHGSELIAAADEAGAYLPNDVAQFPGTLYLVVGYSGGQPTPPDIFFDITTPRFEDNPAEVPYYVTHEAHHIGFLRLRAMPTIDATGDAARLRSTVWGVTQMEGMAVHAAQARRAKDPQAKPDFDYETYSSGEAATRAVKRFGSWMACLSSGRPHLKQEEVERLFHAMSSGERLFFRFGSLVSARLEASAGRPALVATILKPDAFVHAGEEILKREAGDVRCALEQKVAPSEDTF
jgi:hypothetical protein